MAGSPGRVFGVPVHPTGVGMREFGVSSFLGRLNSWQENPGDNDSDSGGSGIEGSGAGLHWWSHLGGSRVSGGSHLQESHISGGVIFPGGSPASGGIMSPGGHISGAVTSLGQSHFWESHISGAVTSLVTTGGHWGWGQWQVSSTWVRVSHSGVQNRQSWRRRSVGHRPMGGDK